MNHHILLIHDLDMSLNVLLSDQRELTQNISIALEMFCFLPCICFLNIKSKVLVYMGKIVLEYII